MRVARPRENLALPLALGPGCLASVVHGLAADSGLVLDELAHENGRCLGGSACAAALSR